MSHDIVLLTFKKWAFPQSMKLMELPLNTPYGDYVSFHTYNFIDVKPLGSCANITTAYGELQSKRNSQVIINSSQNTFYSSEIRIQQSLTLLGNKSDFWEKNPKKLSITLIQRHNLCKKSINELVFDITKRFAKYVNNIAIYFSLDFCDIVLFSNDVPFMFLQQALWDLTVEQTSILKDTITFPCIDYNLLVNSLNGREITLNMQSEKMSYAVDLCVLSGAALRNVISDIEAKNIQYNVFQIPGHYDVRIIAKDISFDKYIEIIKIIELNSFYNSSPAFGGYEIIPLLERKNDWNGEKSVFRGESSTYHRIYLVLRKHWEKYIYIVGEHQGLKQKEMLLRNAEIYRALCSLSKSTFSDEFVLSVLPSLREFEAIIEFYLHAITRWQNSDFPSKYSLQQIRNIEEQLYTLQDEFFRALNMVMQCTMHGEKQFIQAPSLELTLFDIPPKLLMFYSAAVYSIVEELDDSTDRSFSFLISPGFKDDIYVKPISKRIQFPQLDDCGFPHSYHKNKLMVIYLDEKKIYNPQQLLSLLCHEVAHYVGEESRNRKKRAENIFDSIGMYLLCTMTSMFADNVPRKDIKALAETIGDLLFEKYDTFRANGQKYFITDLSRFLSSEEAIRSAFSDPSFKSKLRTKFTEVLGNINVRQYKKFVQRLEYTFDSDYIGKLLKTRETKTAGAQLLAEQIILKLENTLYEMYVEGDDSSAEHMGKFCEALLQSYSEAYADLRMIELLGECDFSFYDKISKLYLTSNMNLQKEIRYNAIFEFYRSKDSRLKPWQKLAQPCEEEEQHYRCYAEARLFEYLKDCHREDILRRKPLERFKFIEKYCSSKLFDCLRETQIEFEEKIFRAYNIG